VTSFGSIPYKDNVARQDSVQVARLRRAGAIIVGKTNTPEFGFTGFTKKPAVWRDTKSVEQGTDPPGDPSGGAAAAIAAGMTPLVTGSDAAGPSVSRPAIQAASA